MPSMAELPTYLPTRTLADLLVEDGHTDKHVDRDTSRHAGRVTGRVAD